MDYLLGHGDAFREGWGFPGLLPDRRGDYRLDLQRETCVTAETVDLT
jgi:hypothetical protein